MRWLLVPGLLAAACGPAERAPSDDTTTLDTCTAKTHCARTEAGAAACEPGFVFVDPANTASPACFDAGWKVDDKTDPVTDKRMVNLLRSADAPYDGGFGQKVLPALGVLCEDGESGLVFAADGVKDDPLQGYFEVTLRFDKDPAEKVHAVLSGTSIVFAKADLVRFAKRVDSAQSVLLQFPTYFAGEITSTFDVSRFHELVQPFRAVCGLPEKP